MLVNLGPDPLDEGGVWFAARRTHVGNEFPKLLGSVLSAGFQGCQFLCQYLQPSTLQQLAAKASLQNDLLGRLGYAVVQFTGHVTALILYAIDFSGHVNPPSKELTITDYTTP
jgi:hypothetical protein